MPGSGFGVDVSEMNKLIRNLENCADDLEHGLNALRDIGPKGLGYDFFDDSCEHFQERWDTGLEKIRETVNGLNDGLKEVRDNYQETEDHTTKSMQPSGGRS